MYWYASMFVVCVCVFVSVHLYICGRVQLTLAKRIFWLLISDGFSRGYIYWFVGNVRISHNLFSTHFLFHSVGLSSFRIETNSIIYCSWPIVMNEFLGSSNSRNKYVQFELFFFFFSGRNVDILYMGWVHIQTHREKTVRLTRANTPKIVCNQCKSTYQQ